jgi:uncharacterized repeat protein (TIGR01451 family)
MLAAVLTAVLALGMIPAPASAATGDFGLSVSNGGRTTVNSKSDVISFEALISLPAGAVVEAGSQTTLKLDSSLKRANNGTLPNGATSQAWDEASNTLTVIWGQLLSGSVYSMSINATPSPSATAESAFQATAAMTGLISGTAAAGSATSAPIEGTGVEFEASVALPQPAPGDWTFRSGNMTLQAGGISADGSLLLTPGAKATGFRNLQIVTNWSEQVGSDGLVPASWLSRLKPSMSPAYGLASSVLVDNAAQYSVSYGAYSARTTVNVYFNGAVPAGTAPGRYSVPIQILDDAANGDKVVIADAVLTVIVPEPAAAVLSMSARVTPGSQAPGMLAQWSQTFLMPAASGAVKDMTVTLAVPEGVTPRGINVVADTIVSKSLQYATDADLTNATWQTLPLVAGSFEINLEDPSSITGIRYVMRDFQRLRGMAFGSPTVSLQIDENVPVGTELPLAVRSVTYNDPILGATALAPAAAHNTKLIVAVAQGTPPVMSASQTSDVVGDIPTFGVTYANGSSFGQVLGLNGSGTTAVEKPYVFAIVPKGMSTTGFLNTQICDPYSVHYYGGCAFGVLASYPKVTTDTGSVVLSDGSTLYYARATSGELVQGRNGFTTFTTRTTFKMNALLAGENNVMVGMGSMTQGDFTVDPISGRSTPGYTKKSLTEPTTFGGFSGVSDEITAALDGIGVTAENAMVAHRSVFISPSTSLKSVTTIKGSEDTKPVVQGAGTATTRPGGSVNYEIAVTNTGSATYKNFQFIDVLPRHDDTFILNSGAVRNSAFDVNLSGNVKVLVNGVASAGAALEYSTSTTPERFDSAGADVAGDAWVPYTGSANGAKSVRVTLADNVPFAPGDVITLSFDGTVPASAPRDGSTANNSIAYRFQSGTGAWTAAEAPAVAVRSSAPTGDTALGGQAFFDLNGNAEQDSGEPGINGGGVSLELYKVTGGNAVAVPPVVTPNTDNGVDGVFSFVGLDANGTYKVKPISSNPNVTFPAGALDADGFLKYAAVVDKGINAGQDTKQYVGKSEFKVGDEVGIQKWIKDLRLPVNTVTTVTGGVVLTDITDSPVAGSGAFLNDYEVTLKKGAETVGSTTTNESGQFTFDKVEGLVPADYTVEFTAPEGSKLAASAANNAGVFTGGAAGEKGVYTLRSLQPGVGATGVSVYYTESLKPTAELTVTGGTTVSDVKVNPTAAEVSSKDEGTSVAGYTWKIVGAGTDVASGSVTAKATDVKIPAHLPDGEYTFVLVSRDLIGNVSDEQKKMFTVDKTAPVLSSTATSLTHTKGENTAPANDKGWIDLFGITAVDAGVGMPATGGITVDASAVKTAAGTYKVTFTATDAAGNVSAVTTVDYVVGYVGDPTVMLGTAQTRFEMGSTQPTDAEWIALLQVTAAAGDSSVAVASITVDATGVNYAVAGSYDVTFTATDALGYTSAPKTGVVIVEDTTKPALTVQNGKAAYRNGDTPLDTNDTAAWVALFGATATDGGSGIRATDGVTVNASAVDYTTAGTYNVIITATDNVGNKQSKTVTYSVEFAGAPLIDFTRTDAFYEMGDDAKPSTNDDWVELFGAAGRAAAGTTVTSVTADASAVDFTTRNTYDVTFTVTDSFGNTAEYVATYTVHDSIVPELKLEHSNRTFGSADVQLDAGDAAGWIALFGATAKDSGSGMPAADGITVNASAVNYTVAGAYPVVFTATDQAGNKTAVNGSYTVRFAGAPTMEFGAGAYVHEMGDAQPAASNAEWIALFEATAKAAAGATVKSVVADASQIDYATAGIYQVTFVVTDSFDNAANYFATFEVTDSIAPALKVATEKVTFARGDVQVTDSAAWIALFTASAKDAGSGMPAAGGITVDSTDVDYTKVGTYEVRFTATDNAGNTSKVVTAEYTVTFAGAPTVAFDNAAVSYEMGATRPGTSADDWIALFGAKASSASGTDVGSVKVDASKIDYDALGSYKVTFTVTDSAGNADDYVGTYKVVDTTNPVVTIEDATRKHAMQAPKSPWTATEWTEFLKVTATDDAGSGIDHGAWTIEHAVNWLVAGTYEVALTAKDKAGNPSSTVTGVITIQAPPVVGAIEQRLRQNTAVELDPLDAATTAGTFKHLDEAMLGAPSKGGSVHLNGTGVTYTPAENFSGVESVTITVEDDLGQTAQVVYTFTVVAPPRVADGASFVHTVPVDGEFTLTDAARLTGIIGENLAVTDVSTGLWFSGAVTLEDGNIAYRTDGTDWTGGQEFSFTVVDDLGQELQVPVTVIVEGPTFTTSIDSGHAGTTSVLTQATGLVPGASYTVEFHSTPVALGTIVADVDGSGQLIVEIPADATMGEHRIVLTNAEGAERGSAPFTVLAVDGQPETGNGGLALTGGEITTLLWAIAGLLLALGALLVIVTRRRRKTGANS